MMKSGEKQKSLAELKTTKRDGGFGDSKYHSSMVNNPMMYSKIAKLQETGQTYCQKKELERERLDQLNEEIREASILLDEKRKEIMEKKRSPKDDNPVRLEKKMKAMHLRIDNIRNKYNFSDSCNRDLKADIEKLRKEINLYKKIQQILSKKIAGAKEMASETTDKNRVQDKKFEEGTKTLYKHQSEYQLQKKVYDKEFQSVYKVLGEENRDQRKREKFGIKGADGSIMKSQSPWSKSGSEFFKSQTQGFQDVVFDKHNKQAHKKHDKKMDGGQNLEQIKEELDKYDEVFQLMVESCLNEKVDLKNEDKKRRNIIEQEYLRRIINTFADYEDQKNAIYQYINSLRDENEHLEKQKKEIEDEIAKYEKLPDQIKQDPKVQKCFEIEKQIKMVMKKKQYKEYEHRDLMLIINQLKMQIPVVFEKIGCDSEEYTRELGEEYGPFNYKDIDEGNIIQYLAILEKRTNDLLQLQNQAFNNGKQSQYSDQRKQKYAEESNLSLSNMGGKPLDSDLVGVIDTFKQVKNEESEKEKKLLEQREFMENARIVIEGLKNKKKKDKR